MQVFKGLKEYRRKIGWYYWERLKGAYCREFGKWLGRLLKAVKSWICSLKAKLTTKNQ